MAGLTLDDRTAIADAIHSYFRLVDSGQASRTAALFTADATLTFGPGSPQPGTITGAAIRAAMVAREAQTTAFTRHIVTNLSFAPDAGGVATSYLLTLYRSDDHTRSSVPAFVADVAEVWTSASGHWQMTMRSIAPAFMRG
jgi:ketosteroid isomerase-like protein